MHIAEARVRISYRGFEPAISLYGRTTKHTPQENGSDEMAI